MQNKIELNWYRNNTWGLCPTGRAYINDNVYKIGGVTGMGYCKQSTAIAKGLNRDTELLKLLERVRPDCYGYRVTLTRPNQLIDDVVWFEQGVGMSTLINILEKLGLNPEHYSTDKSDLLLYDKVTRSHFIELDEIDKDLGCYNFQV